jgi:hypothetical protein
MGDPPVDSRSAEERGMTLLVSANTALSERLPLTTECQEAIKPTPEEYFEHRKLRNSLSSYLTLLTLQALGIYRFGVTETSAGMFLTPLKAKVDPASQIGDLPSLTKHCLHGLRTQECGECRRRSISFGEIPDQAFDIRPEDKIYEPIPPPGYKSVALNSRTARRFLGTKLSHWPSTKRFDRSARVILREADETIFVPKAKPTPSPKQIERNRRLIQQDKRLRVLPYDSSWFLDDRYHPLILGGRPIPRGPSVMCKHAWIERSQLLTYICADCSGRIRTGGSKVHRLRPLLSGNEPDDFTICFQERIVIGKNRRQGYDPHIDLTDQSATDYELLQVAFAEIGAASNDENRRLYTQKVQQAKSDDPAELYEDSSEVAGSSTEEYIDYSQIRDIEETHAIGLSQRACLNIPLLPTYRLGFIAGFPRYLAPPNAASRPVHKCDHGVWFGADNCRVCNDVAFTGKQTKKIWDAVDGKNLRATVRGHYTGDLLAFALVRKSAIDEILGIKSVLDKDVYRSYDDRVAAFKKDTCIVCGEWVKRGQNFCQSHARTELLAVAQIDSTERFVDGYTESRIRPLPNRDSVKFNYVLLYARTLLAAQLTEILGIEIDQISDHAFQWACREYDWLHTLLTRFWLFTHETPVADIAAFEGIETNSAYRYIARHSENMQQMFGMLGCDKAGLSLLE